VIVRADGLTKRFGDLLVLRDVSLSLSMGEHLAVLGPSGCGKTTLLRILLGLEEPTSGTMEGSLSRAGYLPQETLLFPWKTLIENLELPLEVRGIRREERRQAVEGHLERFGLLGFETSFPHELSGGMRQRAALLRSLLTGADAFVLDEPFGALDTLTRHRLQEWFMRLLHEVGQAIVFVTHDVDEAIVLSDRMVLLTERPASVLGEVPVDLAMEDRESRYKETFGAVRTQAMERIQRGATDVQ